MSKDVGNIVSVECKEHKVLGLANHVREELIIIGESPKWGQNIGNKFDKRKTLGQQSKHVMIQLTKLIRHKIKLFSMNCGYFIG